MRLVITGSPGTGKTTIARKLSRKLKYKYANEHELALKKGFGKFDHEQGELVVPLRDLRREMGKIIEKEKNIILEGHLLCEIRLAADAVIVLRVHPEILESRLEARGYNELKTQDNVFCEGIDYCKKHALRKYGKKKLIEIRNEEGIKETLKHILLELREREFI